MKLVHSIVRQDCRNFTTTAFRNRQKTCYQQSYQWLLDVHKSRQRARYPWVPREPETVHVIKNQPRCIPEMRVELIVPCNLESCELKPYVAWKADVVNEPPLTTDSLFEQRYGNRIRQIHEEGKNAGEILTHL